MSTTAGPRAWGTGPTAGSVFDVAAVVAFVGWSIIELVVLWAVGIFRREPA